MLGYRPQVQKGSQPPAYGDTKLMIFYLSSKILLAVYRDNKTDFSIFYLQDCKIYLCGTKLDLIEEALQPREVQSRLVTNYARGGC